MRENTCLFPKKKDPLPNKGTRGLSLLQNYFVEDDSAYFFLNQIQKLATSEKPLISKSYDQQLDQ